MANSELNKNLSLRRMRLSPAIRDLTREVRISHRQMIQPYFANQGLSQPETIPGLTGVYRETTESLITRVEQDLEKGCNKIILFGVPENKVEGKANSPSRLHFDFTSQQISNLRKKFGKDLWISVDVCLCSYTVHGQCGLLNAEENHLDNPGTVHELAQAALSYAQAGADCVAPSDMMDGRVAAIREALDKNTLHDVSIMSYSAKFHSRFYGPFRLAADSAPKGNSGLKDRATYQIDFTRPSDALLSSERDANEGADILMVKPGLPYLDILAELSRKIPRPWAVYQVSGEYASIEILSQQGLMNGPKAHVEAWTAFVRAGASMIITYGARNAREWIDQEMEQEKR